MSLSKSRARQFKTVLIGDSGVGKTSIRRQYMGQSFSSSHIATLGVDFAQKNVMHEEDAVRLIIWDLAGQHTYESVRKLYYQGCHSIIFVYDVLDRFSFQHSAGWFLEIKKYMKNLPPIAILGNKIDLRTPETDKEGVPTEEGATFAKKFSEKLKVPVTFRETSALSGENVDEVFDELITQMFKDNPV